MLEYHGPLMGIYFFLGLLIGSFLNVVIYRFGSGVGMGGRSKCLSCGKTLTAVMLIPLFSFLFQRGKCAHCGSRLSFQYPLVELVSGLLFVMVYLVRGFNPLFGSLPVFALTAVDLTIWSTLLLIVVYDLKHKIIPDTFSLLFGFFAVLHILILHYYFLVPPPSMILFSSIPSWLDYAAAPLLATPFALLWFLSGGRAMGFGDAKIAWGIGWFLGLTGSISAVLLSFWIAFFPSLVLLLLPGKKYSMKSEIPFAPFLVIGTLVVYFGGVDVFTWTF